MSRGTRRLRVLALALALIAGACTDPMMDAYEAITGHRLTPGQRAQLRDLPDDPFTVGRHTIHPDGTVTTRDCGTLPTEAEYAYTDMRPAMHAWWVITCERGWPLAKQVAWERFAWDVIVKESGGCWNVRGGGQPFPLEPGCPLRWQGRGSDSGFGQITSVFYRPGTPLCFYEQLCSWAEIIATPRASMTAFVFVLEWPAWGYGQRPWCYPEAKGYHDCRRIVE